MRYNKYFVTVPGESSEEPLRVMPSEYLQMLHPHKAIAELKDFIDSLENDINQYFHGGMLMPEHMGTVRNLAFELEIAQSYLTHFAEAYSTVH